MKSGGWKTPGGTTVETKVQLLLFFYIDSELIFFCHLLADDEPKNPRFHLNVFLEP